MLVFRFYISKRPLSWDLRTFHPFPTFLALICLVWTNFRKVGREILRYLQASWVVRISSLGLTIDLLLCRISRHEETGPPCVGGKPG